MKRDEDTRMGLLIIALGFPTITIGMKLNGTAEGSNLAWTIASTITYIELGILALLLFLKFTGSLSPSKAGCSTPTHQPKPEPTKEDLEAAERAKAERARREAEYAEQERFKAEKREWERLEEERVKQEVERLRLNLRRTRSFEAALETALEDF